MADNPDLAAASADRVAVSEDGRTVLFGLTDRRGRPFTLTLPEDQLMVLMLLASQAATLSQKTLHKDPSLKKTLLCEGWEFGLAPDGEHMYLSFQVEGGIELSFLVHRRAAGPMQETLERMSAQSTSSQSGTVKH